MNPNQKQNLIPLYNPLEGKDGDFVCSMRDDNNVSHSFAMPSKQVSYFNPIVARHMKKHLADKIYHQEGNPKRARDLEMADIYARIEVSDD